MGDGDGVGMLEEVRDFIEGASDVDSHALLLGR